MRASVLNRYRVVAVGLVVCLVGFAFVHSVVRRSLRATSGEPAVQLAPASLSFGVQAIEEESAPHTVAVRNTGTAPLQITGFAVKGENSDDFSVKQNCPSTLSPGQNCALSLTFKPSAIGPRESSVVVLDTAMGVPQDLMLEGRGSPLSLSISSFDFGEQGLGSDSSLKQVTVTNKAPGALHIVTTRFTGTDTKDFSLTSTCGETLEAGAQCVLNVKFKPTSQGRRTTALQFLDRRGENFRA